MIYEKDGAYVNPAKGLLQKLKEQVKPMSDEKIGGVLNQGPKEKISAEDIEKLIAAAAESGSLPAQMHRIRKEESADMLRKMQEFAEEYNKKHSFYTRPTTQSGWVCPKCGAANAPFVQRCPCVPLQVTCYNT